MIRHCLMLLFAAVIFVQAAVVAPKKELLAVNQDTCQCTITITEYRNARMLQPRQATCTPVTVTVTPSLATIASLDPVSISSLFSYASRLDSAQVVESSQDRPTGDPPETTSLFFTHTAPGPAIVGSEASGDSIYHQVYSTTVPVAVTTIGFPPADPMPAVVTVTITTTIQSTTTTTIPGKASAAFRATTFASLNGTATVSHLEKRQTCSMVFAQIFGQWASWCNPWNGTGVKTYESYATTVLETTPVGASPIPESVYDPSGTLKSSSMAVSPSSTQLSSSVTQSSLSASVTVATVVVTITDQPHVVTETAAPQGSSDSSPTSSSAQASSSCGQVGDFIVTFDNLPPYSTSDPQNVTDGPPIWDRYDHFYWTSGYRFGPPPNANYSPIGSLMAEYNPLDAGPEYSDAEGRFLPGSFGAGPRITNNIYWFDATSAYFGCNNTKPDFLCTITATGYRWTTRAAPDGSIAGSQEVVANSQNFTLPPCVYPPCMLTQVYFDVDNFKGLSTLNLEARSGDEVMGFFLDSFELTWSNDTCAAGLARQSVRK